MHKQLAADLAKVPPPPEEPSKLRWWPHRVGMSRAGDMGFDLGGWKIEGQEGGGWFFTIWQKQADGGWLWPLDVGAGRTHDASLIPTLGLVLIDPLPSSPVSPTPHADIDKAHNLAIARDGPVKAAIRALSASGIVSASHLLPATTQAGQIKILAERPLSGYETLGVIASKSGDLTCCYGRSLDTAGKAAGYYVRLWRQEDPGPRLVIDLFLKVV